MYDKNNVFAKIVRGEIPANKVYENAHAMSFHDVSPMFSTHVLVVPKGEYENILDFATRAPADEQVAFWNCFAETAKILGADTNFNILANTGADAPFFKQTVPHFHLHLMAGNRNDTFKKVVQCLCD